MTPGNWKEAYAIVEALKKCRHYLIRHHFKLITDEKSVAFMFNFKTTSKIKKIPRWRIELFCFSFDVSYRPGKENLTADTLSRVCCTASSRDELWTLHNNHCRPGITRMVHAVRCRNLPFSVEEVKRITNSCRTCAEIKPGVLIKATQLLERLNLNFKGLLQSKTRNRYL